MEEEVECRRRYTWNRAVHDISSSLDPTNYKTITYLNGNGQWDWITVNWKDDNKQDMRVSWVSEPPASVGRKRACKLPEGLLGKLTPAADHIATPLDSWALYFKEEIMDLIVSHTNNRIAETIIKGSTKPYEQPTDRDELRALFGLMYLRGLEGKNTHSAKDLFDEDYGHFVFGYQPISSKNPSLHQ